MLLDSGSLQCLSNSLFTQVCNTLNGNSDSGWAGSIVQRVLNGLLVFIVIYVIGRIVRSLATHTIERSGGDPQLRTLLRNVLTAAIYLFAVFGGLVAGGLELSILLTFGGLASLAIGLAFQDLLRNILAGIWILAERPFRLSDVITVGDVTGTVQTISLRTTLLRTADGRLAVLPNLSAFNGVVINASAFDKRQFEVALRLPADVDLEKSLHEANKALKSIKGVMQEPAPVLQLTLDGEAAVLRCSFWVDYRSFDPTAVQADVASNLWTVSRVTA